MNTKEITLHRKITKSIDSLHPTPMKEEFSHSYASRTKYGWIRWNGWIVVKSPCPRMALFRLLSGSVAFPHSSTPFRVSFRNYNHFRKPSSRWARWLTRWATGDHSLGEIEHSLGYWSISLGDWVLTE